MPEGPEVETIRLGLQPVIGTTISKVVVADHKIMNDQKELYLNLENTTIDKIERRGKFLLWYFKGKDDIIAINHLGMTGVWYHFSHEVWSDIEDPFVEYKHFKIYFELSDLTHLLFVNIRTFGRFKILVDILPDEYPAISNLGPDILQSEFDIAEFVKRLLGKNKTRTKEIGKCLLDPTIVAGCGNIYKSEALFYARINPFTPVNKLSEQEMTRLGKSLSEVAKKALKFKGSTLRDYKHVDGYSGLMQNEFVVYDRFEEPCKNCQTLIKKMRQGDRTSYWCPKCQPLKD